MSVYNRKSWFHNGTKHWIHNGKHYHKKIKRKKPLLGKYVNSGKGIKYNKKLLNKIKKENIEIFNIFNIELDNGMIGTTHPKQYKYSQKDFNKIYKYETDFDNNE